MLMQGCGDCRDGKRRKNLAGMNDIITKLGYQSFTKNGPGDKPDVIY